MADADILLDTNQVDIVDGDVQIAQDFEVSGSTVLQQTLQVLANVACQQLEIDDPAVESEFKVGGANAGKLEVVDNNGQVRIEMYGSSGQIYVRRSDGSEAARIDSNGLRLKNSSGQITAVISSSGSAVFYEDVIMSGSADIKLDSQYLAARLDDIEQRLDNGGL